MSTKPSAQAGVGYQVRRVLVNCVAASFVFPGGLRVRLMRCLGVSIADYTHIASGFLLRGLDVSFGSRVSVNHRFSFVGTGTVTIEDGVFIGPSVTVLTDTHPIAESGLTRADQSSLVVQPVTIGQGAWIGASVTILPGCHVAPGCLIAAGAIVTRPTKPNGFYAGVPAERKKDLSPLNGAIGRLSAS